MSKRLFDIVFSVFGLIVLSPLFLALAIWIKLDSKGDIFYRQERIGRYGKPFLIHKFRTMNPESDRLGRLTIGQDKRITKAGQFLRKSKLDELPQLIDVFIGKMSFVGPRPEVLEFLNEYPINIKDEVLSVRPGITDKASLEMIDENALLANYENPRQAYIDIILPLKQKYYIDYVRNNSIFIDLKIIFSTFIKIIR